VPVPRTARLPSQSFLNRRSNCRPPAPSIFRLINWQRRPTGSSHAGDFMGVPAEMVGSGAHLGRNFRSGSGNPATCRPGPRNAPALQVHGGMAPRRRRVRFLWFCCSKTSSKWLDPRRARWPQTITAAKKGRNRVYVSFRKKERADFPDFDRPYRTDRPHGGKPTGTLAPSSPNVLGFASPLFAEGSGMKAGAHSAGVSGLS